MSFIWTTKDGREIPIEEMDDRHLFNTYKFLQRRLAKARRATSMLLSVSNPDSMAYELAEKELFEFWDDVEPKLLRTIHIFKEELKRRGLPEEKWNVS